MHLSKRTIDEERVVSGLFSQSKKCNVHLSKRTIDEERVVYITVDCAGKLNQSCSKKWSNVAQKLFIIGKDVTTV